MPMARTRIIHQILKEFNSSGNARFKIFAAENGIKADDDDNNDDNDDRSKLNRKTGSLLSKISKK